MAGFEFHIGVRCHLSRQATIKLVDLIDDLSGLVPEWSQLEAQKIQGKIGRIIERGIVAKMLKPPKTEEP